jgi:uncharacterized protein (TIGR02265 family)
MTDPPAGPHIKGQLFQARFAWLKETHGSQSIERVLQALSEDDRKRLRGIERETWYPFATFIRFDEAIARLLEPDDDLIYEHLGVASARHRTEWLGDHARLVSVHGFLSRAAEDHRRFHSFGAAVYRRTGFNEGELEYTGYPEAYDVFCRSSRGFFQSAVEQLTGSTVTVEERQCQVRGDRCCLFWIHWGTRT